jgi:hypothetical protein
VDSAPTLQRSHYAPQPNPLARCILYKVENERDSAHNGRAPRTLAVESWGNIAIIDIAEPTNIWLGRFLVVFRNDN